MPTDDDPAAPGADRPTPLSNGHGGGASPATDAPSDPAALAALHEVLVALGRGADQADALRLVAEKALLLTGCASAAVALLEPDRENVRFAAVAGEGEGDLLGTRVRAVDTVAGGAARTGEPFLAFRPRSAAGAKTAAPALSPESAAVVPIYDDGRPVGSLAALGKGGGRPFAGADLMALQTLAAAAAVAVSAGRLRGEAARQRRELATLYEAVRRVSGELSGQEVLRAVVEQASANVESCAVAVFLLNDERTHLYVAEETGLSADDREVTLAADAGPGALALAASAPLLLSLADPDDPFPAEGRAVGALFPSGIGPAAGARAALAAPIRSGDTIHGVLIALSGQPPGAAFGDAEANLLSALASQAAVAIENAYLYEDATRRAEEAATLYELSQAVTSTLSLPDVLDRVADAVLSLLAVDKFALFLKERRSGRLKLVNQRGLTAGAETRLSFEIGRGIPGWVAEFETPTAVRDVAADHRNAAAPLHPEGVVSMTAMPLQVGAATIGVLCALSSRRRHFTVAEMELLYTVANQAAIAIENARVYAAVRHKSLELRKYFHRVARALGSSHDPAEVPELIAALTMEVMGADRCALYAVSPSTTPDAAPRLTPLARAGFRTPPPTPDAADLAPTLWVARRARPLAVPDLGEDARFAAPPPLTGGRGKPGGSYLGVPLKNGETVVGVLELYTRQPRAWRGDEVRLLLTFASQAALAFRSARSSTDGGRRERALRLAGRLLERVTTRVAGESALRADPDALLVEVSEEMNAPVALLRQDDGPGGAWRVVAAAGSDAGDGDAWHADALRMAADGTRAAPPLAAFVAYAPSGRVALAARRDPTLDTDPDELLRFTRDEEDSRPPLAAAALLLDFPA